MINIYLNQILFKIFFIITADTPYYGGLFRVKIILCKGFPAQPPKAYFITKIFVSILKKKIFLLCSKLMIENIMLIIASKCSIEWRNLREYSKKRLETRTWYQTYFTSKLFKPFY